MDTYVISEPGKQTTVRNVTMVGPDDQSIVKFEAGGYDRYAVRFGPGVVISQILTQT